MRFKIGKVVECNLLCWRVAPSPIYSARHFQIYMKALRLYISVGVSAHRHTVLGEHFFILTFNGPFLHSRVRGRAWRVPDRVLKLFKV